MKLLKSEELICQAKGNELMASYLIFQADLSNAALFLQKAEQLYLQEACSEGQLMTIYKYWAQLYYTKSDFAKAQFYTFKLLHSAELAQNFYEEAGSNTMIAQLFNQTNQANKGIIYSRRAVALLPQITNLTQKNDILFKLSKRYLWHYQDTKTQSSLDSSELFSQQNIALSRQLNDKITIGKALNNLQGIEYEKGNLQKALVLLDSSFAYIEPGDYNNLRTSFYDKADILLELGLFNQAAVIADSALVCDFKLKNDAYIADTYDLIARIAKAKGDYQKALKYSELSRSITDSIRTVERSKEVAELERKYNQAKNEKTIKELTQERSIYVLLALTGVLIAVVIGFFLRQQSLKHKKNILETEQRLNRARMNPHFFFNALTTLQKIAFRENSGQAIASNLSKFSNIMRTTLESTYKEFVTVEYEIAFLQEYLDVQKIRFPQAFSHEIRADDDIEIDEVLIPPMIIQPFVENSIEHGFKAIDYTGTILVHFQKQDTTLVIWIKDNGKGLTIREKKEGEHISRAIQIIEDRMYLLNSKLKTKANFHIENAPTYSGVVVKIQLPLLYKSDNLN
ncbi:MAG: histidine kinase [Spirosomataceae bacterium]